MFWQEPSLGAGNCLSSACGILWGVLRRGTGTGITAPRQLLHPGKPDKDFEEKAAATCPPIPSAHWRARARWNVG